MNVGISLRISQQIRRSTLFDDYVYLHESDFNIGKSNYPIYFIKLLFKLWQLSKSNAKRSGIYAYNDVWDLADLSDNFKPIGCNEYLRLKRIQEVILSILRQANCQGVYSTWRKYFNDTLSPVSRKDPLRILWHWSHILIWNYNRWKLR